MNLGRQEVTGSDQPPHPPPILTCRQMDGPTGHMEEGLAVGDIALSQTGLIQGLHGVT